MILIIQSHKELNDFDLHFEQSSISHCKAHTCIWTSALCGIVLNWSSYSHKARISVKYSDIFSVSCLKLEISWYKFSTQTLSPRRQYFHWRRCFLKLAAAFMNWSNKNKQCCYYIFLTRWNWDNFLSVPELCHQWSKICSLLQECVALTSPNDYNCFLLPILALHRLC